jgi:hypothetical protein
MFGFGISTLAVLISTATLLTRGLAMPAVGNATVSTSPSISLEMFKRAVSAPYVFTAFTSASESNLYVYTSNDGTNFNLLKGPTYTPPSGLIRDPSVILHTEYVCFLVCILLAMSLISVAVGNTISLVCLLLLWNCETVVLRRFFVEDTTDWTGTNFAIAVS